jgi:hypothetical protein
MLWTFLVMPAKVLVADVVEMDSANTVLGKPVAIMVDGGEVMINVSKVVITDIEASNGVVHVIDAVLLRPAEAGVVAGDTLYQDRCTAARRWRAVHGNRRAHQRDACTG